MGRLAASLSELKKRLNQRWLDENRPDLENQKDPREEALEQDRMQEKYGSEQSDESCQNCGIRDGVYEIELFNKWGDEHTYFFCGDGCEGQWMRENKMSYDVDEFDADWMVYAREGRYRAGSYTYTPTEETCPLCGVNNGNVLMIYRDYPKYTTVEKACNRGDCDMQQVLSKFPKPRPKIGLKKLWLKNRFSAEEYEAQSFKPPASAIANAKRGLKLRQEWGRGGLSPSEAKSQGIDSGVTRARKIASGKVSTHDVRRMSAFNRHRKNYRPDKKMPDGGPTAGTIAWLLWGGTSGVNWAKKKSATMNAETFEADVEDTDRFMTDINCSFCGEPYDGTEVLDQHEAVIVHRRCAGSEDYESEDYGVGGVWMADEEDAYDEIRQLGCPICAHELHTVSASAECPYCEVLWHYHEDDGFSYFEAEGDFDDDDGDEDWDEDWEGDYDYEPGCDLCIEYADPEDVKGIDKSCEVCNMGLCEGCFGDLSQEVCQDCREDGFGAECDACSGTFSAEGEGGTQVFNSCWKCGSGLHLYQITRYPATPDEISGVGGDPSQASDAGRARASGR